MTIYQIGFSYVVTNKQITFSINRWVTCREGKILTDFIVDGIVLIGTNTNR